MIIYDERNNRYEIDNSGKIGEGAQGAVYRANNNKNILLKLAYKTENNNLKFKVNTIRSLELNKNLNFAIPILNLDLKGKEYEGYVMLLMEDMIPISKLLRTTFTDYEEVKKWYQETGGLKRRIEILKKISYNLYQIHSKGLIYGDISPNNIFISENPKYSEAWFIDCDNIDFHYNIDFRIGSPGFCSPEIRRSLPPYNEEKKVNTIENDIYAFANLAHIFLFLADPFKGSILDSLQNNEKEDNWEEEDDWGDDWGDEEEDDKERIFDYGQVAWIGEGNEENKPIYGLTPSMNKIISENLKKLFDRTLGKKGREFPETRPSLRLWYEELKNFSLLLNNEQCDCGYSYYDLGNRCKNCSKNSNLLLLEVTYKNTKNNKVIIKNYSVEERIDLSKGELGIGVFDEANDKVFGLLKLNKKFYLKNYSNNTIILKEGSEKDNKEEDIIKVSAKSQVNIKNCYNLTIELEELTINIRRVNYGLS